MNKQLKLTEDIKEKREELKIEKEENIKKYLESIKNELYLWDMRTWKKYKDIEEIKEWVMQENIDRKNCGHVAFCIEELKKNNIPTEEIIKAIMENPHIQYKNRIVPCFLEECPKFAETGSYAMCDCGGCEL